MNRLLTVKEFEEECRKSDKELDQSLDLSAVSKPRYKEAQRAKNEMARNLLDNAVLCKV